MKKVKKNDEETFQDPYQFVIATPLNTDMFKEPHSFEHHTPVIHEQEKEEVENHFVSEAESHFVLPKTPSPIPSLSPIPEPEQQQQQIELSLPKIPEAEQQQQIELAQQTENIYDQLLGQQQYLQQTCDEQQQFLQTETNEIDAMGEQRLIQQFLTQQYETNVNETNMCEEEVVEEKDIVMSTIAEVINKPVQVRTGKNITMLKKQYQLQEEEEEEEEEEEPMKEEEKEEELRTTTKNNKRFHKHLVLKKKDEVIKRFPILSQKNNDLIVTAENKYKELKSIFILKKKYVEKNKQLKEHIYGLELIEHRYRTETERLNKKKKKKIF